MKKYVLKDITLEYTIRAIESLKREKEQLYRNMQAFLDYKDFGEESKEYKAMRQEREAMRLDLLTLTQVKKREELREELKELKNINESYSNKCLALREYIKMLEKKQSTCAEYVKLVEKEIELDKKERDTFKLIQAMLEKIAEINRSLIK